MELFIVLIIVAAAVGFTLRSFVKIYKGEQDCSCGERSCRSKSNCDQGVQILDKN